IAPITIDARMGLTSMGRASVPAIGSAARNLLEGLRVLAHLRGPAHLLDVRGGLGLAVSDGVLLGLLSLLLEAIRRFVLVGFRRPATQCRYGNHRCAAGLQSDGPIEGLRGWLG